jgi:hypothetical protein
MFSIHTINNDDILHWLIAFAKTNFGVLRRCQRQNGGVFLHLEVQLKSRLLQRWTVDLPILKKFFNFEQFFDKAISDSRPRHAPTQPYQGRDGRLFKTDEIFNLVVSSSIFVFRDSS